MSSIRMSAALATLALVGAASTPQISLLSSDSGARARVAVGKVQQIEAAAEAVAAPVLQAAPLVQAAVHAAVPLAAMQQGYFDQLRAQIRYVNVRWGDKVLRTPDDASRLLLAQSAAQRAKLSEVGLGYHDVYGVIEAETSWVPRMGLGKNGTPSFGLAQFEPATAKAIGLTNPNDPVEAVHAAAVHLKQAAVWSSRRIASLKLDSDDYAAKLREGISIYYNLSSKGRAKWNGTNTAKLPVETRRHIRNTELGAREAAELAAQLQRIRGTREQPATVTASAGRNGS